MGTGETPDVDQRCRVWKGASTGLPHTTRPLRPGSRPCEIQLFQLCTKAWEALLGRTVEASGWHGRLDLLSGCDAGKTTAAASQLQPWCAGTSEHEDKGWYRVVAQLILHSQ